MRKERGSQPGGGTPLPRESARGRGTRQPGPGAKAGGRGARGVHDGAARFRPVLSVVLFAAGALATACVGGDGGGGADPALGADEVLIGGVAIKRGTLRDRVVSTHPASALKPPSADGARAARDGLTKKLSGNTFDPALVRALQASVAELALLAGDVEGAEREARTLLRADARDASARRTLVRAALTQGRPREALRLIESAAVFGGVDADLLCLEGLASAALGDADAARAAWKKAVDRDPAHVAARLNLGAAAFANRNVEHAGAAFARVLELDPRNADAAVGVALVEAAHGRTEVARGRLQELLGQDPRNALALLNLAFLEGETRGRPAEALAYAQRYLALGLPDSGAKERLARLEDAARAQLARAQDLQDAAASGAASADGPGRVITAPDDGIDPTAPGERHAGGAVDKAE